MRMNELTNTRFFSLLAEPSQEVTNEEMHNAYAQFTTHMEAVSKSDDYTSIFRMLNVSRIELAHLQTVFRYEQGEKCPEKCVLQKSDSIP
jgi:hypothetical protein